MREQHSPRSWKYHEHQSSGVWNSLSSNYDPPGSFLVFGHKQLSSRLALGYMATEIQSSVRTLAEVMSAMAPFAGGSVPDEADQEFADWVSWIQQAQEEYARRAMWRRCLTRLEITLTAGYTTVLPARFHKPNGIYMLVVTDDNDRGIDWNDADNVDGQNIFIEMVNDPLHADYGKWRMRFLNELPETRTAVLWYFSNPPKPVVAADILLLPGDMIAYKALGKYFFTTGAEGSQDNAEQKAEDLFAEYLSLEALPNKSELMTNRESQQYTNRLLKARNFYRNRPGRNTQ